MGNALRGKARRRCSPGTPRRYTMDITTILIIVLIVLLLGGGFYGRGRWY